MSSPAVSALLVPLLACDASHLTRAPSTTSLWRCLLRLSPAFVPERCRELLGQGRTRGWRWTCSALCWEETLGVPSGSCSLQICSEHTETGR